MKIIVASKNPVKINSALEGFLQMFPDKIFDCEGVSVPSGVADQPMSDEETLEGAINRANNASELYPDADYWVGMEGGIHQLNNEMMTFGWVCVKGKKMIGKGRTASFFLSPKVADLIREGKELGEADDIVFGQSNSKQQNGAIGLLTQNVLDRSDLFITATIIALIPFKNLKLYGKTEK